MTPDDKWLEVRKYYERGNVRFKFRPSDKKIEFLYSEMKKLQETFQVHFERSRKDIQRFISWDPSKKSE